MTKLKDHGSGSIQVADDVLAIIAGTAALEIDGVLPASAGFAPSEIAEMLMKKHFWKSVKIEKHDNKISVALYLLIKIGYRLNDVSAAVQERVKETIENMTGLDVVRVDVVVAGVFPERVRRPKKQEVRLRKA
jgi:uncharacterized alkaline shock family protein YloU